MTPQASPADMLLTRSILVLGAGELGMAVLRPLSRRAAAAGVSVAVMLRPATIGSQEADKRTELARLRELGVELVPGDIAAASVAELADLFAPYDTVLSCIGFAAGRGTQLFDHADGRVDQQLMAPRQQFAGQGLFQRLQAAAGQRLPEGVRLRGWHRGGD